MQKVATRTKFGKSVMKQLRDVDNTMVLLRHTNGDIHIGNPYFTIYVPPDEWETFIRPLLNIPEDYEVWLLKNVLSPDGQPRELPQAISRVRYLKHAKKYTPQDVWALLVMNTEPHGDRLEFEVLVPHEKFPFTVYKSEIGKTYFYNTRYLDIVNKIYGFGWHILWSKDVSYIVSDAGKRLAYIMNLWKNNENVALYESALATVC